MRYFFGVLIILPGILLVAFGVPIVSPYTPAILLTIVGVIVATGSFKTFIRGCRAALFPKYEMSDDERAKAVALFKLFSKTVVLASVVVLAVMIFESITFYFESGCISALYSMGVAVMSFAYGPFLALIFFEPVAFILKYPYVRPNKDES